MRRKKGLGKSSRRRKKKRVICRRGSWVIGESVIGVYSIRKC